MKTNCILPSLAMLFIVFSANAQQGINYKAIINDANGNVLENTLVTVQFTILENGTTNVFQENHSSTTDANGIMIVSVGEGTAISGNFNTIKWGSNPHFLKTEINSGEGLSDMGTSEFKTVPYAQYARTTNSALIDEVGDADAEPANEFQTLALEDNELRLSDGGSVILPIGTSGNGQYYYADEDGDGYGNIYNPVYVPAGVSAPDHFVTDFRDCNDENENIHPGAIEIVDGIDNNCNGEIDE